MKKEILRENLEKIVKLGSLDAIEVHCNITDAQSTRFSESAISQNISEKDMSITISSHLGSKKSSITINSWDEQIVRDAVKKAEDIVKILPDDPEYMPPLRKEEENNYRPGIVTSGDSESTFSFNEVADKVIECSEICRKEKAEFAGSYKHYRTQTAFLNSNGLFAHGNDSRIDWICIPVTKEGTSGYAKDESFRVSDIDFLGTTRIALNKAVSSRNPADVEPGKYTLIMEPEATYELVEFLMDGFDAKYADAGMTYLRGKKNTKVFGDNINIHSDPWDRRFPSTGFLKDGSSINPQTWVKNGSIDNLFYSRYWAKKNGVDATHYPTNVILEGNNGRKTSDIVAETENGILATRFWYIRWVDNMLPSVTGMTRDGLFLVRDGRISGPIKNMRFNENLVRIFNSIDDMSESVSCGEFMKTVAPACRVSDFNFTSKTNF